MATVFENSEKIWCGETYNENEYAEFCEKVIYNGGNAVVRISASADYTMFINGKYVASNQFADFPHYKVYDEIDISKYLNIGENTVCFVVWFIGNSGMRTYTLTPGVIYEIVGDGANPVYSGENTPSRKSRAYQSGLKKKISHQLGYSFCYVANAEDNWLLGGGDGFGKSYIMPRESEYYIRPTKKLISGSNKTAVITATDDGYLADFGEEIVGFVSLKFTSKSAQNVNVAYGEMLENGDVKRFIEGRDFSTDYVAKPGENNYTNYMFRYACRYVKITCDAKIDIDSICIIPQYYPTNIKEVKFAENIDNRIYEICMNTLKLCMLEHYVDCPWREQCMYAFDARNQMLAGYSAFADGNFEYARANILLMSKDNRSDELLAICTPCIDDLAIPSFSLHFIIAAAEYTERSNDLSLAQEIIGKIEKILQAFANNEKDGEICKFGGENRWNYYDWSDNAVFEDRGDAQKPDFLINCFTILALEAYGKMCEKLQRKNAFDGMTEKIVSASKERYFNEKNQAFFVQNSDETPTELANSLAVICGIAEGDIAESICEKLSRGELAPCSLSMKPFKYDALLAMNKDKYKACIIGEIRDTYKIMLDAGSTTVWETIEGSTAFGNAGSLCHGWSAMPVHYYNLLMR